MKAAVSPDVTRSMQVVSRAAAITVLCIGSLVLLGWVVDSPILKSLSPSLVTMKVNTGIGLLLIGAGLLASRRGDEDARARHIARALGSASALLGALTLLEYASGWNLHIDQALFSEASSVAYPGRMAPNTALKLVLMGAALVLDGRGRARRIAESFALVVALLSLLALLGHAYGVRQFFAVGPFNSVAFHTAVAFTFSAIAFLFARPAVGLMGVVSADGPGGILARRMLPASILVPATFGWLRLRGQEAGLYGTEFGLALFASSNIVCFSVLTLWNARALLGIDRARRKAEAGLKESEEDLATTLDSIGDAVIATDASGAVTRMNPVAERLTGFSLHEARGQQLSQVFRISSEDTKQAVESPVARVLREGVVVGLANHTVLTARDGAERPIADSGAPIVDGKGALRGVVLVFRDMTEERKAHEALRKSQALFARIFDSGVVGIVVADMAGQFVDANDAFLRIIGYSREDFVAGRIVAADLTPQDWRYTQEKARAQLLSAGATSPWEKEFVRKDGSRVPILIAVARLDGTKVVNVISDLTELKKAERERARLDAEARQESAGRQKAEATLRQTEEQLRHAQKMEAVGRLAGGVAHDFNNVLSVILSYSGLLLSGVQAGDPLRDDLEEIQKAGTRAADLTRQLLMFSRQQVLEPKVLDLNAVLSGMEKMLRRLIGEDVELVSTLAAALGKVRVDPGSIEQVIMNLAVNARDAMPTGGKLTIETANVTLDQAYSEEHLGVTPGPHVLVAVSDTGTGMDKATQVRIFEPFFTTKEQGKGTGLGLSTVFGIVQQSGGSVWVYSELGKGSTFKVYLPVVDAAVDDRRPQAAPTTLRGSETILLVEDEEQVRNVARGILKRHGYRVLEARNAGEALLLCEKHPGAIELLLSDVVMPQMSGPELARRIAVSRPATKLLCMSGYTDDAVVRHGALGAGIAFIQKPFTLDTLARKVREVLDSRPHSGTL